MNRGAALRRRSVLGWGLAGGLGGCAHAPWDTDDITVGTSGGRLQRFELLALLHDSDYVLLGEQHDNAVHHRLRAELLAALPAPVAVVVEHLPRGASASLPRDGNGDTLLRALEAAEFDAAGWRWPLHEPLFAAIAARQHGLRGGNLPRDVARRTAREGAGALPAELRTLIEAVPLPAGAHATLLDHLQHSHCGQLPQQHLPSMLLAQRGRDAAMAASLRDARMLSPRGPVLLLAGNGHVRRDYGVPQLLAGLAPAARMLAVGFVEPGDVTVPDLYDVTWTTPSPQRPDPCAGMKG